LACSGKVINASKNDFVYSCPTVLFLSLYLMSENQSKKPMEPVSNINAETLICKNCGSDNVAEYCSHCGQRTLTKRFSLKSFFIFVLSAFNLERGFFYTLKMLFVNPGKVANEYIGGRTKIYYNPLSYLLLITGISAILIVWLGVFDANIANTNNLMGIEQTQESLQFQHKVNEFIKQYMNFVSLLTLPFISLLSKWVYSKRKLFYGEHLIFNSFMQAQVSVISILLLPVYKIFPVLYNYVLPVGYIVLVIYYSYALRKTFKSSIFKSILNAIVINLAGMMLFMLSIVIMTIVAVIILKLTGLSLKDLLAAP